MATALARGLVESKFCRADQIVASDVIPPARDGFTKATGSKAVETNSEVLKQSDVIVLAVKPQQIADVLAEMAAQLRAEQLVVSIAAGVPIATMTRALGDSSRIARVMPNTPALVGKGASAFALGGAATAEDGELVEKLLATVGIAVRVPESSLDAVTGLSGSGPAFVYQVIEALSDGGVRAGLPRDVATRLAAQTVLGAAAMVLETREHPGALKDAVTSPGGTTIAGLQVLERAGVRGALIDAVQAATERSRQLGQTK